MNLAPPVNRAMTHLDRAFFQRTLSLVEAHFKEPQLVGQFIKRHAVDMLKLKKVRNVHRYEDGTRGVILRENVNNLDEVSKLTPEGLSFLRNNDVTLKPYELIIGYDFWKAEEILSAILPEQFLDEVPSGFTITGHIAHLNLRDEFKPFGELIGQVILDKNPNIRTVVDKVGSIDTVFRTFEMAVIAGDKDLIVEQRESNCSFQFDFSKVYWNSRLHTEHDRLVGMFNQGELVCDVMAGVGPFSVPAGKKQVYVLSNDLNPDSFHWMKVNITKNKVDKFVEPLNLNGRELVQNCVENAQRLAQSRNGGVRVVVSKKRKAGEEPVSHQLPVPQFVHHFVMNLPDSALEFLNEYRGIYRKHPLIKESPGFELPFVHVYCFEKFAPDEEPSDLEVQQRIWKRMCEIIGYELALDSLQFQLVRKVSPTKPMYRVTFRLPEEIAFGPYEK